MLRIIHPDILPPAALDQMLAQGWYRVQQSMMTCGILNYEGTMRSAIWTRTPMGGFAFSKNQRKLMRRNARRFRVETGDLQIDEARRELYLRYLEIATGTRADKVDEVLVEDRDSDIFQTKEIAIYDGDRLVAFSWFDVGETCLQSIAGFYEPEYATHSLGFYSMLLELAYGMDHGFAFHYSGYVLPGEPSMDYKLRAGAIEFFDDVEKAWRPWAERSEFVPALERLEKSLDELTDELQTRGLDVVRFENKLHHVANFNPSLDRALRHMIALDLTGDLEQDFRVVAAFDVVRNKFEIHICRRTKIEVTRGEERFPDELLLTWKRSQPYGSAAVCAEIAAKTMRVAA